MEDTKVLQREALGWYDLAESCKSKLRVASFLISEKRYAADSVSFSAEDLDELDEQAVRILGDVVELLNSFQSKTLLHGQDLAGSSESVIASKA